MVDALLERMCSRSPISISVKVRLGVSDKSDLQQLIPVLNRYPLSEVIIHPRTAEQMYEGPVDLDAFETAAQALEHPVCYNGDINDFAYFSMIQQRFPTIERFMLGRGLLANPFLCEEIRYRLPPQAAAARTVNINPSSSPSSQPGLTPNVRDHPVERIAAFHAEVLSRYESILQGDHPVLGKMKEFWSYQAIHLSNGRSMFKKIRKTQRLNTYKEIIPAFLAEAEWTAS
jgi:tRNA-dihydrouridine synthase